MSMLVTPSSIKIPYYTTYYPGSNYTDFFFKSSFSFKSEYWSQIYTIFLQDGL